jgi:pyrimidine deaminase RibD-like protein
MAQPLVERRHLELGLFQQTEQTEDRHDNSATERSEPPTANSRAIFLNRPRRGSDREWYSPVVIPDWVYDDRDRSFMEAALAEARAAAARGEVPVGCVVVRGGEIIASAGNRREGSHDPAGHAELLALRAAAERCGDWRLAGATMYVTLEPCSSHGRTPPCTARKVASSRHQASWRRSRTSSPCWSAACRSCSRSGETA